ncbi:MAG: DVU_1551 family NTP transferase [Dehalococcoidia bacterium]|jgi:CTP:molybdopterin cytidylyltransferase MocA
MEKPGITAIILAAGYSERMKRFKPLLDLGGQPVIERVISSFLNAGISDIRVVAGYCREKLVHALAGQSVKVVINDRFAAGMFSSVRAGVTNLDSSTEAFFLMPADVPLVRQETIRYLAGAYRLHSDRILIPVFGARRGHPPLIAARFAGSIIDYSGENGLGGVFSLHSADIVALPVPDGNILLDMDTPEDYVTLCRRLQRMNVPTAAECEVIMSDIHGVPDAVIAHCKAVASVALLIADKMNRCGFNVDRELLMSAALLHDLAKGRPDHAAESARIIRAMGYPTVAGLVETHMDIIPGEGEEVTAAEVLYLADKLVSSDRVVPLQNRFGRAVDRYGDNAEAADRIRIRYENALNILTRIEARTGALDFSSRTMAGAQP